VAGLARAWECEVRWCRGPRIVPVADNYDRLGYPAESITREARYTRYVDAGSMLRSHSSAMFPPALLRLARQPADDVLLVCPGIVYRRDAIDWQHTGTPHQLDLWRITRRPMRGSDLDQMIAILLSELTPGEQHRQQPRTHPYTLHGRQVDVRRDGCWVEVWECGLAHPGVLAATACRLLPASAMARLGAKPEQKNLLVRVVLRDLEKTLTNEAANDLRDRIYRALHQGTEYQWSR
jgi:phenylalanyl-tRNA synthetase alpha chain